MACYVCIDYEKGKLTIEEAFKNLDEMNGDMEHTIEVWIKLINDLPDFPKD